MPFLLLNATLCSATVTAHVQLHDETLEHPVVLNSTMVIWPQSAANHLIATAYLWLVQGSGNATPSSKGGVSKLHSLLRKMEHHD